MIKAQIVRKLESVKDPGLRDVLISFLEEVERMIGETITRKEFLEFVEKTQENFDKVWQAINELTRRVNELAEAQKRTEERLDELTERVNSLAEVQKRTEDRLNELAERVNSLAEAQKRTEDRLNELAERVNSLAEAQKRTEDRLNELAEAQMETEKKLAKLIGEHQKTREQIGGLSHSIGYLLEDRAYKGLPEILKKRYGIEVTEPLRRDYIKIGRNRYLEVNILGKGKKDGREIYIIGECKTQLKKKDVDKFLRHIKNIEDYFKGDKFLVIVAYQASPPVAEYIREKGINFVYSYELPL